MFIHLYILYQCYFLEIAFYNSLLSEQCTFYFDLFADPSRGQSVSTDCPLLRAPVVEVNLSDCKRMTCTGGGNILNYLDGICEMRRCQGNDYMLSSARGGWNIYVLDVSRLTAEAGTMLPGNTTSGQDGVTWIPIVVPMICVCILVAIVVAIALFARKRNRRNINETVTYNNTIQMAATMQAAENQTETHKTYYNLKSLDQSESSNYESIAIPTYEELE